MMRQQHDIFTSFVHVSKLHAYKSQFGPLRRRKVPTYCPPFTSTDEPRTHVVEYHCDLASNASGRIIVPSDDDLNNKDFYTKRIWRPAKREARHIGGCRGWMDAGTLIYELIGHLKFADGTPWHLGDIDDYFPKNAPERWISRFLETRSDEFAPLRLMLHPERLRIIFVLCEYAPIKRAWLSRHR